MKTEEKLKAVRERITEQYGYNPALRLSKNTTLEVVHGKTLGKQPLNLSEIEYWRAMTGIFTPRLICGCCGKLIYEDHVPTMMKRILSLSGCNVAGYIARCGKVMVPTPTNTQYEGGAYLVPLCGNCYSKSDKFLSLEAGSILCKSLTVQD